MIMADDFNNAIKRDISMVKGDTMSFGFQIQGLGEQRPDEIHFACKEDIEDTTFIFDRTLNNGISFRSYDAGSDTLTYGVRVPPEATEDIQEGLYYYDLQMELNGDVLTLMKGRLSIEWDISEGGN
jgi:hypothetical protein